MSSAGQAAHLSVQIGERGAEPFNVAKGRVGDFLIVRLLLTDSPIR